jgi:hypothetical protein
MAEPCPRCADLEARLATACAERELAASVSEQDLADALRGLLDALDAPDEAAAEAAIALLAAARVRAEAALASVARREGCG